MVVNRQRCSRNLRSEREGSTKSAKSCWLVSNGLEMKLQKIEEFAMKRLRDIQGLLGGDVLRAKSELAKYCTDITLTLKGNSYMVSGDWNLLGGRSGGAGGPAQTERYIRFTIKVAA
jgi:hypothetical protein